MKYFLILFGFLISLFSYSQANNDSLLVIAKLISPGKGSKIQIAEYELIKTLKGEASNDTISVGYYFYNKSANVLDTALLNLIKYEGSSNIKDYYICPDYNINKGMLPVSISKVGYDYWEGCETGKGECSPLFLKRKVKGENWFLIMPCGGSITSVTLSKKQGSPEEIDVIQKVNISFSDCPPVFDLTNLEDGKYFINMFACELGGQIEINLNSND